MRSGRKQRADNGEANIDSSILSALLHPRFDASWAYHSSSQNDGPERREVPGGGDEPTAAGGEDMQVLRKWKRDGVISPCMPVRIRPPVPPSGLDIPGGSFLGTARGVEEMGCAQDILGDPAWIGAQQNVNKRCQQTPLSQPDG